MKKVIIKSIIASVAFIVIYMLLDLLLGHLHSFRDYAVQTIIFMVVFGLFGILDEKGWNSWEKVGALFKRKKKDE